MEVKFSWALSTYVLLTVLIGCCQGSKKKGLCIGPENFLCDDFKVWHHVNWWYDWGKNLWWLRMNSNCTQFAPNWVAMVWGWRPGNDYPVNLPTDTDYVLGFNEPNIKVQSNLTAVEAASHWPEVEKNSHGLPLVSPSANPCKHPANCHGHAVEWFDEFFKHCNGCRIDYLSTHTYWCSANTTMNYLEGLWHRYGKKIWLTEFACPLTHSVQTQLDFMKDILPRLEAANYIYRYSWFQSRIRDDHDYVKRSGSLLQPHASKLTRLGHYYNNFQSSAGSSAIVG